MSAPPFDRRADLAEAAGNARHWTRMRDDRIVAAREAGWSLRRIGDAVGLTHGAVRQIINRELSRDRQVAR